ncbi:lactoylglutathione lyase [Streptococcus jiangjianxini]|uniref:lactoylglutathione lyase n=1 Tax=Streptococcus jiangjianxini TaxID=3161189 RepID=UPI0032EC23A6
MKPLHTCVRVKDLDASLKFYADALSLTEDRRLDFPDQEFTIVYLRAEGYEYELELTYNYGHAAYELGDGYGHIALGVEDIENLHKAHQEAGYSITDIKGLPDQKPMFYFITDPDGYKIEIISLPVFEGRD